MVISQHVIRAALPRVKLLLLGLPMRLDQTLVYRFYEEMEWEIDDFFMEILPFILAPEHFSTDDFSTLTLSETYYDQPYLFDTIPVVPLFLEVEFLIEYLARSLMMILPRSVTRQFNTIWYEKPDTLCLFHTDEMDLE